MVTKKSVRKRDAEKFEEATQDINVNIDDVVVEDTTVINVDPTAVDKSEANTDERNVRIKLKKPFQTFIGGRMWYFEADKLYSVPENVKFVLNRAGLLSVL